MLKEKIFYKDELPIKVITANVNNYPIHFHDDIEIVFVLDGNIRLRDGYYTYNLKNGDIFIINDREMHSLESTGESNMVMMLQLNLDYFSRYYENLKNNFFVVDNETGDMEELEVLRNHMAKIMIEVLQKGFGYEQQVIESTHNLLSCLISNFRYENVSVASEEDLKGKGSRVLAGRLNRITDYMHENYSRKLTLNEIAEKEQLSIFYLSHIIKEATDLSFQDLLSYIRVEESEKILLETKKKIGAIAEEVGFSAVRYYTKHFTTWFGMHPNEYRKKYAGKTIDRGSNADYQLSSPGQIEAVIRETVKGVYSEYVENTKIAPIIVDVDNGEGPEGLKDEIFMLERIASPKVKAVLYEPYKLLRSMGERVVAVGKNYMVTTASQPGSSIESLSILVYSIDDEAFKHLASLANNKEFIKMIANYDGQTEFLIRCSGLMGRYKVIRHRLSREIISFMVLRAGFNENEISRREQITYDIMTEPEVSISAFTSTDVMNIRSVFKGVGAELILVDLMREEK